MTFTSIKSLCALVVFSLLAQHAWANLLINPTRVDFNQGDRTVDVTLINISNVTTTYRLEWSEKQAKAGGGYVDLNEAAAANFPTASKMIRLSPRQVTLRPNERQVVKLAVRRPQALAAGEYRSHLVFKALPPNLLDNPLNSAATTSVKMVLSFAIPVVISQGEHNYSVDVNAARLSFNATSGEPKVELDLSRTGSSSTMGHINAYWTPNGGKEQLIGKLGDFNFWPELSQTTMPLSWTGTPFAVADGKLRIEYEGTKNFRGKKFFDKSFTINRGMIKTTY